MLSLYSPQDSYTDKALLTSQLPPISLQKLPASSLPTPSTSHLPSICSKVLCRERRPDQFLELRGQVRRSSPPDQAISYFGSQGGDMRRNQVRSTKLGLSRRSLLGIRGLRCRDNRWGCCRLCCRNQGGTGGHEGRKHAQLSYH
jgi:hypothetical protein